MVQEPAHLVGILKTCISCGSTKSKFAYFNNGKPDQPRYRCLGRCGRFFTHGGRSYRRRNSEREAQPPTTKIGVAGDRSIRKSKSRHPATTKNIGVAGDRSIRKFKSRRPAKPAVKPPTTRSRIGVARTDRRTRKTEKSPLLVPYVRRSERIAKLKMPEDVPRTDSPGGTGGPSIPSGSADAGVVAPMQPAAGGELATVDWTKVVLGIGPWQALVPERNERLKQVKVKLRFAETDTVFIRWCPLKPQLVDRGL